MSPLTQHLLVDSRTDTGRYPKRKHIVCYFHYFTLVTYGASASRNGHSIETQTSQR